jgi:hypothetical protein
VDFLHRILIRFMQKIPIIGACLCSLHGIKIHFREFLYDFALKRDRQPVEHHLFPWGEVRPSDVQSLCIKNHFEKLITFLKTYQFPGLRHNGPVMLSLYVTSI